MLIILRALILFQVQLFQSLFQEHLMQKFPKWALGMDDILGVNISSQVLISGNCVPLGGTHTSGTPHSKGITYTFVENH